MRLVPGRRCEARVRDLRAQLRLARPQHGRRARRVVRGERIAALQLLGERHLLRLRVNHREQMEPSVVVPDVDAAPVGDPRDCELRDGAQRDRVVERASEGLAGLREEALGLLGALRVVDVGGGADPFHDLAALVAAGIRAAEVPAIAAVRGPEAVLDLVRLSRFDRAPPERHRLLAVVGMHHVAPGRPERRRRVEAGVRLPAGVQVRGAPLGAPRT